MENSSIRHNPDSDYSGSGPITGIMIAISVGALAAIALIPAWAPRLAATLVGTSPKAYWYLSRGLAMVALILLWISMALGLLITDKLSKSWPGAAAAFAIHEFASLLGLAFAALHALILLGDKYIGYTAVEILLPFSSGKYRPVWVGLGQIAFYTFLLITASFYVRRQIGPSLWKLIHFASFASFMIAIFHALSAGTDTGTDWAQVLYWFMGASVFFLTCYRVAAAVAGPEKRAVPIAAPAVRPDDVPHM